MYEDSKSVRLNKKLSKRFSIRKNKGKVEGLGIEIEMVFAWDTLRNCIVENSYSSSEEQLIDWLIRNYDEEYITFLYQEKLQEYKQNIKELKASYKKTIRNMGWEK